MSWRMKMVWAGAIICGVGLSAAAAQPPKGPEARQTWAAERRQKIQQMDPEERATYRAERHARRGPERANRPPRPIEIRQPLPLPVRGETGKPAGGTCPRDGICTLELVPGPGEAIVVTAVWSADEITCDDTVSSTPAGGQPIAPQWRCQRRFVARGKSAGYTGYIVAK